MRKLLKILNPFIWCWNMFSRISHLQMYADISRATGVNHYKPYDVSQDLKYF